MEIISHAFWAGTAYKLVKKNKSPNHEKKKNFFFFVSWSIFPDIISFGLIFLWFLILTFASGFDFSFMPEYMHAIDANEPPGPFLPIFKLTSTLYNISHSAVIFLMVFGLFFYFLKTPPWTLLGWLFHILIDIPTHSYQFYPTPFLWPISGFKVHGISWGVPWFMALNYSAMILVYFLFWRRKKRIGGS
jgi:hypothetical protein